MQPPEITDSFPKTIGKFLLLQPARRVSLALSDRELILLAFACLGFWLLLDWLQAEPGWTFYMYGMVGVGWFASLILLVAALWSRLSEPQLELRDTLALALAFVPFALLLATLAIRFVPPAFSLGALILIALYASLYGHAGLRSLTSDRQPRAVSASFLVLTLAAWFAQSQYVTPQFWYPDDDDEVADVADEPESFIARRQLEALLFHEAERIDRAVLAMHRPANLPVAGFFLGFAGVGEQRVFASEIALADRVIGTRYGTSTRSLQLLNDRRNTADPMFATPSSLRHALHDIAMRMNLDQDVLFLALSSHGSEEGALSVSYDDLPFNDLHPEDLASALHEAGIQWRVIIVSACYSGAFVEPLRDDRTIVITASAVDRTSFGCSDDRDLTYFGEAFYRDALPTAPDLRTAFQRAVAAIVEREQNEDIEASHPQAYFGREIELHLRKLRAHQ